MRKRTQVVGLAQLRPRIEVGVGPGSPYEGSGTPQGSGILTLHQLPPSAQRQLPHAATLDLRTEV